MARFYFSPKNCLITVNNVAHRDDFSVDADGGYLIINAVAENGENCVYVPLYAVIMVDDDKIKVFGNVRLIDWADGNYEVLYSLERYPCFSAQSTLIESFYNYAGDSFSAQVVRDGETRLLLGINGKTTPFGLPALDSPRIFFRPLNLGFLTILTGKDGEKEYLLLILYAEGFKKIFELSAEKIEFTDRAFKVTEDEKDMLARRRVTEYCFDGANLRALNVTFSYGCDKAYPDELTPYLLLEAVKAKDLARARGYLSAELSGSAESLIDYFGEFTKIECPKYKTYAKKSDLCEVALFYNDNNAVIRPRIFTFESENGKITNIRD